MKLIFELSMPNVGSWNGKWTGAGANYVVVRDLGRGKAAQEKTQEIAGKGSYFYDFGDGWGARISVRVVTPAEATKARRRSQGFYGYDWMVDSIIRNGRIVPSQSEPESESETA